MASVAPAPSATTPAALFALPSAGRRRLRVGVFADRAHQPRWLVEALAKAAGCDFAELAFVCVTENRGQTPIFRGAENGGLSPIFLSLYRHADRWVFGASDWSQPRDVTTLVPQARRKTFEEARREALDVAFVLGDVDDAALDGIARHGVWRYCFGEGHERHEPMAGVREVVDGAPVTASGILVRPGGGAPDRLACRSWSRTLPISVARSRDNLFAKSCEFLARALRDLHDAPDTWLERSTVCAPAPAHALIPGIGAVTRLGARVARRAAEKLLTIEQWSLAFRFAPSESWDGSLAGFHRLTPPKDRFWADPFPIQRGGRNFIFFEELPFAAGKAHISVVEVDREGRASKPERVLERDYHLSYPFLVEDEGELYMIPESAHNDTIEIYRCVDFPLKWRRERVLLDGVWCADATVFRAPEPRVAPVGWGPRWWMFANSSSNGAEIHDELHLFGADKLLGEWKPHRRNPVKSDVRSARPAGQLFWRGAELYRPAQICAPIYGAGVAINRVTRLAADDFCEEEETRILPQGALLGIHTVNRAGDLSVADAFARRARF